MKKHFLLVLIISYLITFPVPCSAQEKGVEVPQTFLKRSWQEAVEIWQKLLYKMKGIGEKILKGRIGNVLTFLKEEILKRKSIFKQELQKEIRELKDEISKLFQKIFKK